MIEVMSSENDFETTHFWCYNQIHYTIELRSLGLWEHPTGRIFSS